MGKGQAVWALSRVAVAWADSRIDTAGDALPQNACKAGSSQAPTAAWSCRQRA
jgi:hypothetical protein